MKLENLLQLNNKPRAKKRLGRGIGSGKGGHTVGRGMKGQKARNGNGKPHLGFEGGQVPLYKRLPRINRFKSSPENAPVVLSIGMFNHFKSGTIVTPIDLLKKKLVHVLPKYGFKVLSNGKLNRKISFKGFMFSEAAKTKLDKSGSVIVK
jgi:large subunit ribosomal protein L15